MILDIDPKARPAAPPSKPPPKPPSAAPPRLPGIEPTKAPTIHRLRKLGGTQSTDFGSWGKGDKTPTSEVGGLKFKTPLSSSSAQAR